MPKYIKTPSIIEAAGTQGKIIEEFFGRVNSGTTELSIARMKSPQGWEEPGQRPEFNEYTVVLQGILQVNTEFETFKVEKGNGILVSAGEWAKYSTPYTGGAEYIAICLPAFSNEIVHRDQD